MCGVPSEARLDVIEHETMFALLFQRTRRIMRRRKTILFPLTLLVVVYTVRLMVSRPGGWYPGTTLLPLDPLLGTPYVVLNVTLRFLHKFQASTEIKVAARPRPFKVNNFDFPFLIQPSRLCAGAPPFLLIIVPSVHSHGATRAVIRATWGSYARNRSILAQDVRLAFLFGTCQQRTCNTQLEREAAIYDDVIQGRFTDSYGTLHLKMVAGLQWISEKCRGVSFVLKVDEDTFANIPAITRVLASLKQRWVIMGRILAGNPVARTGKFAVSKRDYPPDSYPRYAAGHSYVISGDLVPRLFNVSHYVPVMNMEDVYVTGLLPASFDVTYVDSSAFAYWDAPNHNPCDFVFNRRLTATNIADSWKTHIWTVTHEASPEC